MGTSYCRAHRKPSLRLVSRTYMPTGFLLASDFSVPLTINSQLLGVLAVQQCSLVSAVAAVCSYHSSPMLFWKS